MNIALIFAGGTGQRMNSKTKPKQFLSLHGKPIILYTIEWFENHNEIDKIVIVCLDSWRKNLELEIEKYSIRKVERIEAGGKTGQESIYNGLKAIQEIKGREENPIVLIHDGVRPLIDETVISRNIASVKEWGSAITVVNAMETVVAADKEGSLLLVHEKEKTKIAKAPQSFYFNDIFKAHERAKEEGLTNAADSATLLNHFGYSLHTVAGKTENIKITTASDYYIFKALYEARENSQIYGI